MTRPNRCLTSLALLLPLAIAVGRSAAATAETSGQQEPEATSLQGEPLPRLELPPEFEAQQSELLTEARGVLAEEPDQAESWIWVGRRTAYLGRYREAVAIYSRALERFPHSAELLRHRGHRLISLRRLDEAIADLERAAALRQGRADEIEPDGLPNAHNIPTSTLHSNIWYHLGLARYLKGDFEAALAAYRSCLEVSANPDMLSATSHWLYMTLRRLGRAEEAAEVLEPIGPDLEILENEEYFQLLLLYQRAGDGAEELLAKARAGGSLGAATVGYGVGNWLLYNGQAAAARVAFERIVEADGWSAFGYLAAEAELSRWPSGSAE